MNIIDITKLICEEMIVYKNKPSKQIKRSIVMDYQHGSYYESRIDLDMHCGTHIDAPLHMLEGGSTVERLDLSKYIGTCKVYDLTPITQYITKKDVEGLDIQQNDIIVLKTKNSYDTEYNAQFIYLEEDAAQFLVDRKIKCLGMDAMSIERDKPNHETHKILLSHDIGVIEDLQLKDVDEGEYFLSCLPLRIKASEASPVRAVLIKKNDVCSN